MKLRASTIRDHTDILLQALFSSICDRRLERDFLPQNNQLGIPSVWRVVRIILMGSICPFFLFLSWWLWNIVDLTKDIQYGLSTDWNCFGPWTNYCSYCHRDRTSYHNCSHCTIDFSKIAKRKMDIVGLHHPIQFVRLLVVDGFDSCRYDISHHEQAQLLKQNCE